MSDYYCSPLRYPGGKNCIFPFVAELFRENDLIGSAYAEPYAGGAGLALKLLFDEYVSKAYINDLDRSIYAFWYAVLNHGVEFCEWIKDVKVTIDTWHHSKEVQNCAASAELLDLAKSTFFLNRTNVSGVLKGGVIGGKNQTGKFKIDARFNKQDLVRRIERIQAFTDRIELSNLDGLAFVRRLDATQEDIFIYLDPPYVQKGSDLYMNFYSRADHERLARKVHSMRKRWMVSYDHHEFVMNLYSEKSKLLYKLSQSASNRVGDEVLIFSERLGFQGSMTLLSSATQV